MLGIAGFDLRLSYLLASKQLTKRMGKELLHLRVSEILDAKVVLKDKDNQ